MYLFLLGRIKIEPYFIILFPNLLNWPLFSSYLITAPATFRPGMSVNMSVLILRAMPPDAPVTINVKFSIDSKQITSASGVFNAGL